MLAVDVTERFSDRVDNYIKYRPGYPEALIEQIARLVPDPASAACADFGSGTGILAAKLAAHFRTVYGVEPNAEMRRAGERLLAGVPNFVSVEGTAERSGLLSASVQIVTAAQAFHWFDRDRFKAECQRILAPEGVVALVWNDRRSNTELLMIYEDLLTRYATDYNEVNHQNLGAEVIARFFGGRVEHRTFENVQRFDLEGLLGRLDSSSYAPKPGTREHEILHRELRLAFDRLNEGGLVAFNYATELYWGKVQ
ncbi:MAG: class I SAM-dependent methyltransferase [Byssovorax sp.]